MTSLRLLVVVTIALGCITPITTLAWDALPRVDWSKIKPSDFADDELDLPFYLLHFHVLADGIVEHGPERGWINAGVWRGEKDPSYNARVLENYLTLAYFYCTKRPWNPYYASPALRERLEAVLTFWCDSQGPNGEFSEYAAKKWGTAPTAFATKFTGRTLALLKDGPPIDPALQRRVIEADRKALVAVMTTESWWNHGRSFTNQWSNIFGGGPQFTALYPDAELDHMLDAAMRRAHDEFQSPAGFFYEKDGPDFGYTLHTHHSNMVQAYHFLRDTPRGAMIEAEQKLWCEWLSYNLLRETDGSTFVINRAIETRQKHPVHRRESAPWGDRVELARAFAPTDDEHKAEIAAARARLESEWPPDASPTRGAGGQLLGATTDDEGAASQPSTRPARLTITPYAFFERAYRQWYPTTAERDAAVAKLPYLARQSFVHQRVDSRFPLVCTFVRRPSYYAAFNAGTHRTDQQRFGLGLVWTPNAGAVLQSQTGTLDQTWGTIIDGEKGPEEAKDLNVSFSIGGTEIAPEPGAHDLPEGELVISYAVGEGGRKTITFGDDGIVVEVRHPGKLIEQIPLLDDSSATIRMLTGTSEESAQTKVMIAGKRLRVKRLIATDRLTYRMELDSSARTPRP